MLPIYGNLDIDFYSVEDKGLASLIYPCLTISSAKSFFQGDLSCPGHNIVFLIRSLSTRSSLLTHCIKDTVTHNAVLNIDTLYSGHGHSQHSPHYRDTTFRAQSHTTRFSLKNRIKYNKYCPKYFTTEFRTTLSSISRQRIQDTVIYKTVFNPETLYSGSGSGSGSNL